jgi:hypothetical protein
VKWSVFAHDGKTYDLSHLNSGTLRFERPAEGSKAAEVYTVEVIFTLHCFTREPRPDERRDESLMYSDGHERRLFDYRRYELSKQLPGIIQTLPDRKPYQNANRRNFFSVETIAENGARAEYDIFFKVKKKSKGRLELIVETAFVRDPGYDSTRPHGRPVRFWIILHNTLNGIKIRT